MIKVIEKNNQIYARIVKSTYLSNETEFFTDNSDEVQLGYITYEKDYKTGAHYHNHSIEPKNQVDEILIVEYGYARIDFYSNEGIYLKSVNVSKGDTIILYKGGHNILFYEKTRFLTIKPGSYGEDNNETRIVGTNDFELVIEE